MVWQHDFQVNRPGSPQASTGLIVALTGQVEDNERERPFAGRGAFRARSVYSRIDLLRILHITPRQLANWERNGLVTSAESYSFSDLLEIKKVRDLCAVSVSPNVIRQSLDAMRKQAAGLEKPLLEAATWSTAKHRVATPVNWRPGEDVIIAGSVSDDEAKKIYPKGWRSPKPYMRIVAHPRS